MKNLLPPILFILSLLCVSAPLHSQYWELWDEISGSPTDIKIFNDERYITLKTGELFIGDSLVQTFEVETSNETGLHSVDIWNGRLCVYLSSPDSIQRLICEGDTILEIPYISPYSNRHRGGGLVHSQGVLYIGTGCGSASDNAAQDTMDPRGKVFAITDSTITLLAYGLRNPWKMDVRGDTLYIADVGDREEEEVDRILADSINLSSPVNLGWPCIEGNYVHDTICGPTHGPLFTYPREAAGNAIIGGAYFEDAFFWCDNYFKFGGMVYDDSTWMKFQCPQWPIGMYTHGDTLFLYDYAGKIYKWSEEGPLSLDSIPPDKPHHHLTQEERWEKERRWRLHELYGEAYMSYDFKVYPRRPTVAGIYYYFAEERWVIIVD
jgi:hypothetical protein